MIKEHGSTKEKMDNFGQLSAILGAILIFFLTFQSVLHELIDMKRGN